MTELASLFSFTETEARAFDLLAQGCSYRDLAAHLGCSINAAKIHGTNIRGKIEAYGRRKKAQEGISATLRELRCQDEQRGRRPVLLG
jgi:DNA-binding CsgD family transcriptional regulator